MGVQMCTGMYREARTCRGDSVDGKVPPAATTALKACPYPCRGELFMSDRSTSEKQRAPAGSSSDSEAARAGSGAILGGALLVGAAAGYALIAFRFKNMHAGTRGSGGAEVGYDAHRSPSCTRPATPAQAPLHPSHCASADASGGDIQ